MSALDHRLRAHAANLAASWCGPENTDDNDHFFFRAEGFLTDIFYAERGMDDGADGYGWTISREASGFMNCRSRGCHASWEMAVFDAWETLVEGIRTLGPGEKPQRTQKRDTKALNLLIDAFRDLAEARERDGRPLS